MLDSQWIEGRQSRCQKRWYRFGKWD